MTGPGSVETPFDFEAHRRAAIEAYQRVRPLYEVFAEAVRAISAQALSGAGLKVASLEARAKGIDSFGVKAVTPVEGREGVPKYEPARSDY